MAISETDPDVDERAGRPPQAQIADAVLMTYKLQYGKGPKRIKVHLTDDAALVLMWGGFTVVEEALRRSGRAQIVRDQRRAFGDMIAPALATAVTAILQRDVVAVMADTTQNPDLSSVVLVLSTSNMTR